MPYEEILKYLAALALRGDLTFIHNLGLYFEKGINGLKQSDDEAFKYFKLAADQGDAIAQDHLAEMLPKGMRHSET